jgi:hypothetical protein
MLFIFRFTSFLLILLSASIIFAGPWIGPDDSGLRSDIQLLADAGVITAPVTTWPLMWSGVIRDIEKVDSRTLSEKSLYDAYRRIRFAFRGAAEPGIHPFYSLSLSNNAKVFRYFGDTFRERGEITGGSDWIGDRFAFRLQATQVLDPQDDKEHRFDGSYLAGVLGNWIFSAGAVDCWWGPGWDSSLILSNNARPVPAVTLLRNYSDPFKTWWLSWLGPWHFTTFMGKLEEDRCVPNTLLWGARFSFKPFRCLEFGLSRTAQWGGDGRPKDFSTFSKLLIGQDNRGINLAVEDEPGNQLAGFDFRWNHSFFGLPYALYGQLVGEDESGMLPSRYIGLAGLEVSLPIAEKYRCLMYLEAADTRADVFNSQNRYNYAYEHGIYRSGYRYYGRNIGSTFDNDTLAISTGALFRLSHEQIFNFHASYLNLNRDGTDYSAPGGNSITGKDQKVMIFELSYQIPIRQGNLKVGLSYQDIDELNINYSSNDFGGFVQWQAGF